MNKKHYPSWPIALFAIVILLVGGFLAYTTERNDHIRQMGEACSQRVHNRFASADANKKDAYGELPYKTAYAMELNAQAQCIVNYPISN